MLPTCKKLCRLLGVFVIPLSDPASWEQLKYDKLPSHQITHSEQGLKIEVNKSASPLIYPLKTIKLVKRISVTGTLSTNLIFPEGKVQGEKGYDDFMLRVGLVEKGKKTLNWAEKKLAPEWVLKLYSLAPKDSGLKRVLFLNLASQDLAWKQREHPLSDLLQERIVGKASRSFTLSQSFEQPLEVAALWISSDGDDLKQSYSVTITEIKLEE